MASAIIGALRVTLGMDSAAFEKGLRGSQSKLASFGKFAAKGMMVVGAAAAAAAAGISVAVSGTIDAADEMSKAAQKIGIPIEELSKLKYAADLSGVSFQGLQNGVKRLSANMNDAANGVGEAKDAFEQLGISVTNSDGSLKSSSAVMAELADKFAAMPDGAEKTALAMDLMGKSGADMIPLLNGGTDALNKLLGEADTFGQVFTQEMGSSAEAFNDNMARLKGSFANIAAELTQRLLPYLEQFSAWMVTNAPAIADSIGTAIETVATWFINIGDAYRYIADSLNSVINGAVSFHAKINEIGADIIAVFAALPSKMLEIGGQIISGLWNGIQNKWEDVKSGITDLAGGMVDSIKSKLGIKSPSKVMHEVGVNVMEGLKNGMESMRGSLDGVVGDTAGGIEGAFQNIGQTIAGLINGTKSWKDVLSDVLGKLTQAMFSSNTLGNLFGHMGGGGGLGGLFSGLLGGLFGFANGGSFNVGGSGGVDSQLVAFKASPNETVSVTKPGQNVGGGGQTQVVVRVLPDKEGFHAFMVNTADGQIKQAAPAIVSASTSQVNKTLPSMIGNYQRRSA